MLHLFPKKENNFEISYSFNPSPFGECLIGMHEKKVCYLAFADDRKKAREELTNFWNGSLKEVFENLSARVFTSSPNIELLVYGTPFQLKVWNALLEIPFGTTLSYEAVAERIGQPSATRAVAGAIAKNEISYLIPCHRVVAKSGNPHHYRWGKERKKEMLQWEKTPQKIL